jgi:hypothetical protein
MLTVRLSAALLVFLGGMLALSACSTQEKEASVAARQTPVASMPPSTQPSVPASAKAAGDCAWLSSINDNITRIDAAYETTVDQARNWVAQPNTVYDTMTPDKLISVCYAEGNFGMSPPPFPNQSSPWPSFDRGIYLISDGAVLIPGMVLGYSDKLAPQGTVPLTASSGPPAASNASN